MENSGSAFVTSIASRAAGPHRRSHGRGQPSHGTRHTRTTSCAVVMYEPSLRYSTYSQSPVRFSPYASPNPCSRRITCSPMISPFLRWPVSSLLGCPDASFSAPAVSITITDP